MQLGTENRNKTIAAVGLMVVGAGDGRDAFFPRLPGIGQDSHPGGGAPNR